MQHKRITSSKLIGALLAGAFCAAPIVVTTAQAAPNRPHQQRDRGRNDYQRNLYQTFTGVVSDVERNSFDLRVGNKEYEVHPSRDMPDGLSRNDRVRVYGQVDDDDIRNANVTVLRDNDRGNNGHHWGHGDRYQTFTGIVSDVERNSFDLRVGNKTYEVHPSGNLPRQLSRNDRVRVYGQVDDDDIRNANVTVLRDNDRGNNGHHWGHGNRYQTFTGIVSDVERNSFDLRVGNKEYEVHPSGNLPRQLSRNDRVRVYGQVDDDDIRNASVTVLRDNDRDNDRNDHWGAHKYQTITGTVEKVSGNSFDLKANNKTYRVRLSGKAPDGLSKNDVVRVYGQVYGSNDIRNANVAVLRNR